MPRKKSKYMSKQVSFIKESEDELALFKWLQKLPHGEFSNQTKEYWLSRMNQKESDK